jgi:hypothetical protein
MKNVLIIFLFLLTVSSFAQVQLGKDINEAADDESAWSVSLSSDGSIVAIGAAWNNITRIYQYISGAWVQMGQDINGETRFDQSGWAVSLSSDGNIVAIGARGNGGNGNNSGHTRIYQYESGSWVQLGKDIDGQAEGDGIGGVSLSSDGSIVAMGAYNNDGNGSSFSGHSRIFQYQLDSWVQLGNNIDGDKSNLSGYSVSLSSDGNIVAIGAISNSGNGKSESGNARIYQYISGAWVQMGQDINGEGEGDRSGSSVSLSSDGLTVAIGAIRNGDNGSASGHTRIYQHKLDSWVQIGQDIDGNASGDFSGGSVSLSSDGSIVAIGSSGNDGNGSNSGLARIYQNQSDSWVQLGIDINGVAEGDASGHSVSLSSNGNKIAIGAHEYFIDDFDPSNDLISGYTRIFEICELRSISANPIDIRIPIGETAITGVKSDYNWHQWQTDVGFGYQNITNAGQYSGSNNDSLTVSNVTMSNNNQYFRCIVSTEGCSDTSKVAVLTVDGNLGIEETENLFKVYPNPTSEELNITIATKFIGSTYKILDLLGKKVLDGKINNTNSTIDVSTLSKGYYLLQIGDGTVSHKFMVQ